MPWFLRQAFDAAATGSGTTQPDNLHADKEGPMEYFGMIQTYVFTNGVAVHLNKATFGKAQICRCDDPSGLSYDTVW